MNGAISPPGTIYNNHMLINSTALVMLECATAVMCPQHFFSIISFIAYEQRVAKKPLNQCLLTVTRIVASFELKYTKVEVISK